MPHRLINQIQTLQGTDLGQQTNADEELSNTQLDLNDKAFDLIDKILQSADCLFSPSYTPTRRQVSIMEQAGIELTLTDGIKQQIRIQTTKGYFLL